MRSLNNYILDEIFVLFYVSDLHIEAFYRVRKYDTVRKFPGYGKFLGCGNFPGYRNYAGYGKFLNMEGLI